MKKILVLIALIPLFYLSCKQKQQTVNENLRSEMEIKTMETESRDSFSVDESKYELYGSLRPGYELGFDDNNHAFLTDKRSNLQIVFMCSPYGQYAKEDFLTHYDEAIKEDRDLKEVLSDIIEWCKQYSEKEETLRSEHFQSTITRFYVPYEKAYSSFHI